MKKLIALASLFFLPALASSVTQNEVQRDARSKEELKAARMIQKFYANAVIVDMLIPGSPQSYVDPTIKGFEETAAMSIDWGFNYVSYSCCADQWIDPTIVISKIAKGRKHWLAHPDKYVLIDTSKDILQAKQDGKLAVSFNFQGSNALGRNLDMIEVYYKLGVRQIGLTYDELNFMAEGSNVDPKRDTGLSSLGKRMVAEMNRVGMIIDCSHASDQAAIDVAAISKKPIVMSHSLPKGFYNIQRNASDEAIKAVAETGGVIAISGIGGFLSEGARDISPQMIADHANYLKLLVGAEHVAFASDFVRDLKAAMVLEAGSEDAWPDYIGYGKELPVVAVPGTIWGIVRFLEEEYDWTYEEIRGILGENALRVYRANWNTDE
ncbi:MAG: membrane dipeptidase [Planctomycetota bacterium]|jgi:membrane dipeptidase